MNDTSTLEQVFTGRMFRVPDYQRGYAWGIEQVEDLLSDLDLLAPGRTHYAGTLVVSCADAESLTDEEGHTYKVYDVIDGQQRLTTVVILLDAVRGAYSRLDVTALADGLRKTYLSVLDRDGQPHTKLTLNQDCQDFFYGTVLGFAPSLEGAITRSHENLLQAHRRCESYLAEAQERYGDHYVAWLDELSGKITQGLKVLIYEADSEIDAGVIFETMNDRGKPLTDLEKIKNYLLYLASKLELVETHDLGARINRTWKEIYEALMASGLGDDASEDQLLRVHWLMAYDPVPRNWQRYDSVKGRFGLRQYRGDHARLLGDILDYLASLRDTAKAYCDIHAPTRAGAFTEIADSDIRTQVLALSEKLVRLGTRATFLPLLCAVRLRAKDDGSTYLKVLKLCELYNFNQFYWGLSAERLISSLTKTILRYCPDPAFLERFDREDVDWYHWSGVKYFLYEYELHLAKEAREPVIRQWEDVTNTKRDTIEHILPQGPTETWLAAFPTEAERERWTHDIGNLTLTYDNSALSNKSFADKRGAPDLPACYAGSTFFVERQLARHTQWTATEIQARRDEIKVWAVKRWAVDDTVVVPDGHGGTLLERVRARAVDGGVEEEFEAICSFADQHQLYIRAYPKSMGLTAQANRTRVLCTVWPKAGHLRVGVWFLNFERILHADMGRLQKLFDVSGERAWVEVVAGTVDEFLRKLETALEKLEEAR